MTIDVATIRAWAEELGFASLGVADVDLASASGAHIAFGRFGDVENLVLGAVAADLVLHAAHGRTHIQRAHRP